MASGSGGGVVGGVKAGVGRVGWVWGVQIEADKEKTWTEILKDWSSQVNACLLALLAGG